MEILQTKWIYAVQLLKVILLLNSMLYSHIHVSGHPPHDYLITWYCTIIAIVLSYCLHFALCSCLICESKRYVDRNILQHVKLPCHAII